MWDGLVIGGGLAGFIAGIRALERGKKIMIVSEGIGSLAFASGVLDFGRVEQLQQAENHPYALWGEAVQEAFAYFLASYPSYRGLWGRSQKVLTPLGTSRATDLLVRGLDASPLDAVDRIILVVPAGLKDFFPEVVKANLQKEFGFSTIELKQVRPSGLAAWQTVGKSIPDTAYAKFWCSEMGREFLRAWVAELRRDLGSASGAVIFPGLHVAACPQVEEIMEQIPWPVVEMTSFPPSALGHALYYSFRERFKNLGGELLLNSRVERVEAEAGLAQRAIVKSKGKEISFSAKKFILATGGILGRGLVAGQGGVRETVFGLPLHVPREWSGSRFLGKQPYAYAGVVTDRRLRPVDPVTGETLLENVLVVGRMLAHWDPWVERCGGGVSLTSGFLAGGFV